MTSSASDPSLSAQAKLSMPGSIRKRSPWNRVSIALQLFVSLGIAVGALVFLVYSGSSPPPEEQKRPTAPEPVVRIASPKVLHVTPGTPLDARLQVAKVESTWLDAPVLPVTGMTLASLKSGKDSAAQDAWQFATSDLLSAFADWQKSIKDIQFQETQLKAIRELNESKIEAQKKVVDRMERLVKAGTDTEKDLVAEKTNLIQFEIQARKDIHDQEQTVFVSQRTEATLSRQLQQAGLDPAILRSPNTDGDIIVAEVPERDMERVKLGMTCDVRFIALAGRTFSGKVSSIAPVISKDKRVLNVQFTVKDPQALIRPGMFADIGLGVDKREALLMPADGALHVGESDYALVAAEPDTWKIVEIRIGALHGTKIEVLSGLKSGDRVLGKGAILLKPVAARALHAAEPASESGRLAIGVVAPATKEARGGTP
jgi:membrane fusion protein, heavy metal efflux system